MLIFSILNHFCPFSGFFLPFSWCFAILVAAVGPLAQSAERGADNAKVVSSTLTRTTPTYFCCFCFVFVVVVVVLLRDLKTF